MSQWSSRKSFGRLRFEVHGPIFSERRLQAPPENHSPDFVINDYLLTHAWNARGCPDERAAQHKESGRRHRHLLHSERDRGELPH